MSSKPLIQTALLVALCVAIAYLFAGVPNIELLSAAVFTSGVLMGARRGAVVGLLAEGLYSAFNPYGVAPPPLYAAQLLGFALIGATGGAMARPLRAAPLGAAAALSAIAGFGLTLVYDVLTNSAIYLMARESSTYIAVLLGGLCFPFPLAHPVVNTVGFALLAPAVVRAVQRRSPA